MIGIEMTEVEETQLIAIVLQSDQVFDVLVREVLQCKLQIVRIE